MGNLLSYGQPGAPSGPGHLGPALHARQERRLPDVAQDAILSRKHSIPSQNQRLYFAETVC